MKRVFLLFVLLIYFINFGQEVKPKEVYHFVNESLKNTSYKIKNINIYNKLYLIDLIPQGFIIISGDYRVDPVLAYSFINNRGKIDDKNNIKNILDFYVHQISEIANSSKKKNHKWDSFIFSVKNKKSISPLLSIAWNQGPGYNQYCPEDSAGPDGHALVGCVATAAAQIMYYLSTPDHGLGHHSYTHKTYGILSADFANTTYDWAAMQNNDMQAIAMLMYHIGVSVEMDYGADESGANVYNYGGGFDLYKSWNAFFRINSEHIKRQDYSDAEWKEILKADLNNNKPVLYTGSSDDSGHAWVCDGYDDNDLFHMNWGWGGSYNGYYNLDNLAPGSREYTQNQSVLHNIEPYTEYHCSFDEAEENAGWYLNNDEFRNGLYLQENNLIASCLTPGDQDWYIVEFDNNGITEMMDILVTGATAQTEGNYILSTSRDNNILTIETKSFGEYVDTKIAWKCMCNNGSYPKVIIEDDNSGEEGVFSKIIIDLSQIQYTEIPDFNFMKALNFESISPNPFLPHIFTEYINHIPFLELNYKDIEDFTGIEGFENLQEFWCYHNNITSLDVSQNHKLKSLICRDNKLTTLLLNPEIEEVYTRNNYLTSMDLTNNPNLREISFSNNNLHDFDLRNGNYQNLTYFRLTDNPNLSCVFVDNKNFFDNNWSNVIDSNAVYVEDSTQCEIYSDTEPPVANCQNISVNLDNNGEALITASQIDNGSSDNIEIVNYILSNNYFNCDNLGLNNIELTVEDPAGNTNKCSAIVTVIDNIKPTAITRDIQLDLTGNSSVSITAGEVNNGSYDNCDITSMTINKDTFTETGIYNIEFIIEDSSSNFDTSIANIEVIDSSLDISDVVINNNLKIYPNPLNDKLNIKAQDKILLLTIIDFTGKELFKVHPNRSEFTINLKEFNTGVYIIKLWMKNKNFIYKILKK